MAAARRDHVRRDSGRGLVGLRPGRDTLLQVYASAHQQKGQPRALPPEREKLWREAIANLDFKMYPHVYNVLALKGQHSCAPQLREFAHAVRRGRTQ